MCVDIPDVAGCLGSFTLLLQFSPSTYASPAAGAIHSDAYVYGGSICNNKQQIYIHNLCFCEDTYPIYITSPDPTIPPDDVA